MTGLSFFLDETYYEYKYEAEKFRAWAYHDLISSRSKGIAGIGIRRAALTRI